MKKEWFIKINNKEEGPFSSKELKRHPLVTPDTLVRKKNQSSWIPIRFVVELKEVFEDEPEGTPLHEPSPIPTPIGPDQATLTLQQDPFQFILWLLVLLIILTYTAYRLYA
jgi:GYF domain 2